MPFLLSAAIVLLGSLSGLQEPPLAPPAAAQETGVVPASSAQADAQPATPNPNVPPHADAEANRQRVASLFEGALIGARDGQDFAETPGYRRLLEIVSHYTDDELRARVEYHFDYQAALKNPDDWRGHIVSVRRMIAVRQAVRLAEPIAGHVDTYRAFVSEGDGSEGVVVDFLGEPPDLDLKRDLIDTEAVFYCVLRYESRNGKIADVPYLIARNLRRLDPDAEPRHTAFDMTFGILIAAAVAFLVVRIVMTMRGKKPKGDDAARAARLLRERARLPLAPKSPSKSAAKPKSP